MTRLAAPPLALAAALAVGCAGHATRIVTDEREALIWVDGRYVGRGTGTIRQVGPPHTGRVLVVVPDGRRGRAIIQRAFTSDTATSAFRTLGICLALCWEYPAIIKVPLPPPRPKGGWALEPDRDPWLLAPGTAPTPWDEPPRWAPASPEGAGAAPPSTPTPRGPP